MLTKPVDDGLLMRLNGSTVERYKFSCDCKYSCCKSNPYKSNINNAHITWETGWEEAWTDEKERYYKYEDIERYKKQLSGIASQVDSDMARHGQNDAGHDINIPESMTIRRKDIPDETLDQQQKELDRKFKEREKRNEEHVKIWQQMKEKCAQTCSEKKDQPVSE